MRWVCMPVPMCSNFSSATTAAIRQNRSDAVGRAYGIDERPLNTSRERKSVGWKLPFAVDIALEEQGRDVAAIAGGVIKRLQRREWRGQIARQGGKIKFADFQQNHR